MFYTFTAKFCAMGDKISKVQGIVEIWKRCAFIMQLVIWLIPVVFPPEHTCTG